MTNKNPAQILDAYLLKFRGSKKAKLTQQPIELKRKKAS
jgi:hypothetical protein